MDYDIIIGSGIGGSVSLLRLSAKRYKAFDGKEVVMGTMKEFSKK